MPLGTPAVAATPEAPKTEGWMKLTPIETQTPAPVVATDGKGQWGPSYEVILPAPKVVGPDGSEHVEGLEHVIGRSNPLLPEVKAISPAIATVGEEFPALHVDQIPLADLMHYLKAFTDKTLTYALPEPLKVTLDLKPSSVEEVFQYIAEHYDVEVVTTPSAIVVQQKGVPAPEAPKRATLVTETTVPSFMTTEKAPVVAYHPTVPAIAESPLPMVAEAPLSAPVVAVSEPDVVTESMWRQMRKKAALYDLERERQALLDRRSEIERAHRTTNILRSEH